ncbi:neutral/alkaline non-lysosomal ceramidase N-terminal domain-containing protein [Schnuerera sp. xch1]|uniref:neutral/alkaline non-lysosomal ceramidase N-terminal domain-containing protein n=1 Tax=Schnuerera sp. xch1 TaxID=2874283 RepID=UPI001CBBAD1D|nr:neutral/alkaline non-lysosomal ceramidase N-terminal domain-containing protein [Schnuerera sp. xch1]MBZ2174961.1 neutral/alkaline non-lysosomal ceramidase N-terminal domain-containing protein [Schnuerera sp. xch1]
MYSYIKANISSAILSIPKGVYMAGYGQRDEPNKGTHDDIYTKALTVSNGEKTIIIISNDLLGVNEDIVKKVVLGINKEINILEEDIFVCATHTHAAPDIFDWEFDQRFSTCEANKKAKEYIINAIIKNALNSTKELKPVKLAFGRSKCDKIASNRINKDWPIDDMVNGIFLIKENDCLLSAIVNYACHATVLGADNLYISADYPGIVQKLIEEHFGKECTCMFINGACGNQSTRFTRKSQNFDEVKRLGNALYESVLESYDNREYIDDITINSVKAYFDFPRKELPSREEALKHLETMARRLNRAKDEGVTQEELREAITKHQGAMITLKLIDVLHRLDLIIPIQLMKLGDILITGIPVELFSDYGILIKEKSSFSYTIIAGYTNGMVGYVYTPESYKQGDYEAWSSPFDKHTGDFIVEKVVELMKIL